MDRQKILWISLLLIVPSCLYSQSPAGHPAAALWATLSSPSVDPAKSAFVENVEIVRDRVRITFEKGTIHLMQQVNGIVFGAIFRGKGRVRVDPPGATEAQMLRLFSRQDKLEMTFTEATLSFSPGLLEEVLQKADWRATDARSDDSYVSRQREREEMGAEYLPRLLKSVLSRDPKRTAYFLADLRTNERGWLEFRDDAMQPEEIRVGRWGNSGSGKVLDVWLNFPAGGRNPRRVYDDPARLQDFLIAGYKIDASVAENGELEVTAQANVLPHFAGETVLLFSLDSKLRVSAVKDEYSRRLEFFQSRESQGSYVAVVLAEATEVGKPLPLSFQYGGKGIVQKVGEGNYFCQSFGWYPSIYSAELGVDPFAFRYDFDLTFRSPKKYTFVATGTKSGEKIEGRELITTWKSDIPLAAAGFAFGDYKITRETVGEVEIAVYTNNRPDDMLRALQRAVENPPTEWPGGEGPIPKSVQNQMRRGAVGNLTPAALGKTVSVETANTLRVFQNYFGPYPYRQLAVTNIPFNYGQGWPGLLYLAWFTFLDSTQRHVIGFKDQIQVTDYFRAHESSHQWWGHRVGWKSYHDQWLCEGFAEFSGKLYVQMRQNSKEFLDRLRIDRELLQSSDSRNRPLDSIGPIWMGRRISSSETDPTSYQNLIYTKGGYVLQMLRSQMADLQADDPDRLFKAMLKDYSRSFENRAASTEDFKGVVERYMTRGMDLEGNQRMDWFFDQYVYGTGIPHYDFQVSVEPAPDGRTRIKGTISRSGVSETWKDVVPLYAHIGEKTIRLGTIAVTRPTVQVEFTLPLRIDRISINDYADLLADVRQ